MTYSLEVLHPWILNFICSMIRLQGFRIVKFSLVENSRWLPLLKIAKLLKSPFSPEWLGIFGWNFVWSISRTLMSIDIKMKKICSGIRSQSLFENLRAFKSIQMTYSLKSLHPWFSNLTCSMTRLQGFRKIKFRLLGNQIWPLLLKIAKPLKSTFPHESLDIFDLNFV